MPQPHPEKLYRRGYRLDGPTLDRLNKIAKVLAKRDAGAPSVTQAIRYVAQVAEVFTEPECLDILLNVVRRVGAVDASGAPAIGVAIKFLIKNAGSTGTKKPREE